CRCATPSPRSAAPITTRPSRSPPPSATASTRAAPARPRRRPSSAPPRWPSGRWPPSLLPSGARSAPRYSVTLHLPVLLLLSRLISVASGFSFLAPQLDLRRSRVARSDLVQMEGVVKEVMVGGNFRVEVEGGHNVLAQLAGNMRRNRIRVVLGDQVTVA